MFNQDLIFTDGHYYDLFGLLLFICTCAILSFIKFIYIINLNHLDNLFIYTILSCIILIL